MINAPRNPSSFADAIEEAHYACNPKIAARLVNESEQRIVWIRKKFKTNATAQQLADKIEGCRRKGRCKSLACPKCANAAKRLFVQTTRRFLKGKDDICCITIVPGRDGIDPGHLSKAEHDRFVRRNRDRVARALGGFFIGVVDWSMNEYADGSVAPSWFPHLHGIARTSDIKGLKRRLKHWFTANQHVFVPVKVTSWDGDLAWLRYCHADGFERRVNITSGRRFDKKTGEYRKCRDTDHQPPRSRHNLELLLHRDAIGIAGRLCLRGVQFQNLTNTGPTFIDRPMKGRVRETE